MEPVLAHNISKTAIQLIIYSPIDKLEHRADTCRPNVSVMMIEKLFVQCHKYVFGQLFVQQTERCSTL